MCLPFLDNLMRAPRIWICLQNGYETQYRLWAVGWCNVLWKTYFYRSTVRFRFRLKWAFGDEKKKNISPQHTYKHVERKPLLGTAKMLARANTRENAYRNAYSNSQCRNHFHFTIVSVSYVFVFSLQTSTLLFKIPFVFKYILSATVATYIIQNCFLSNF